MTEVGAAVARAMQLTDKYSTMVEKYISGVLNKKLDVPEPIYKMAVKFRAYQFHYDYRADEVDRVCHIIETLALPEGQRGAKFVLMPWQCVVIAWCRGFFNAKGNRAINDFGLLVPRKAGKSSLFGALLLYELAFPLKNIHGNEILLFAANDQGTLYTFNKMRSILRADAAIGAGFCEDYGMEHIQKVIRCGASEGYIERVSATEKVIDGRTAYACFADEISALPTSDELEIIRSGFAHNEDAIMLWASTFGSLETSALEAEREVLMDWLNDPDDYSPRAGMLFESTFDDDINDPRVWRRVHPALGMVVSEDWYAKQAKAALTSDEKMYTFRTRQMCVPLSGGDLWINQEHLQRLEHCSWDDVPPTGDGWVHYVGCDFSDVRDTTSLALFSVNYEEGLRELRFKIFYPTGTGKEEVDETGEEKTIQQSRLHRKYAAWADDGHVVSIAGDVMSPKMIAEMLREWNRRFDPPAIVCDHYDLIREVKDLCDPDTADKILVITKNAKNLSEPLGILELLIRERLVRVENNPAAMSHFKNAHLKMMHMGGRIVQKQTPNSKHKIDAVDAAVNAVAAHDHLRDEKYDATKWKPLDVDRADKEGRAPRKPKSWVVSAPKF